MSKGYWLKALVLINLVITLGFVDGFAQTKRALVFAIGNYPAQNGWHKLSSARDAGFIKTTLTKQGFEDIVTVLDSEATYKGMCQSFEQLIKRSKKGDVVVIHVSSHGAQVEDDNGDEADGLDECIVTFNAVASTVSRDFTKSQAEYFRDDKFGFYLDQLRSKLGKNGDVVVLMDCCHSGTGTRGIGVARGGLPPLVSKSFDPKKYQSNSDTAGFVKPTQSSRGDDNDQASYVVFSAARDEELDYEIADETSKNMGSLSYSICKVFESLDAQTTYRTLFATLQGIMNSRVPNQHPVLEGNGLDRSLFGGNYVKQKPYYEIENIREKRITIKAGSMAGMNEGAKVALYPSGTTDPSKAEQLAEGTVTYSDNFTATVLLNKEMKIKNENAAWVFVQSAVYKTSPIHIQIQGASRGLEDRPTFSESELPIIKSSFADLPLVKMDNSTPDLLLVKGRGMDTLKMAQNGLVFTTLKTDDPESIKSAIQNYAQYKFLQELDIKGEGDVLDITMVPVINGVPDSTKVNTKVKRGQYEFQDGDVFELLVKNKSPYPIYFNILDMQPDGLISPVLPNKRKKIYPDDLKLPGNTSRLFPQTITVRPPFGTEIFKVFVSRSQIDVESIANSRGAATRGNFGVLENLVCNSYHTASRGVETESIGSADGSTFNLLFNIKPKE